MRFNFCIISSASEVEVNLGSNNLEDMTVTINVIQSNQQVFFRHPNNTVISENNIALIKLPRALIPSETVKPIGLPTPNKTYENEILTISGLPEGDEVTNVKVISQNECAEAFDVPTIDDSLMCTVGYPNPYICFGYAGGPLMTRDGSIQVGILIYGSFAGNSEYKFLYQNIKLFIEN